MKLVQQGDPLLNPTLGVVPFTVMVTWPWSQTKDPFPSQQISCDPGPPITTVPVPAAPGLFFSLPLMVTAADAGVAFATNAEAVRWLMLPLVPVNVSLETPVGVDAASVTVTEEEPVPQIEVGLKAPLVALAGNPLKLGVTQ